MTQAYHCLPTDLWHFHPKTPKGFYLNRGVFYFGRKVENAMAKAEADSRKNRKPGPGVDQLANAARLGVLSKFLGVEIKRHRDPGNVTATNPYARKDADQRADKDETIVIQSGF